VDIEDEKTVILAESYLNAAFECLSRCFFAQESQPFGAYCTAQMMAAAKLVQNADSVLLGLRSKMECWDRVHQGLSRSAAAQVAILQVFYRQLASRSWREMRQEDRIRHTHEVFGQIRHAMQKASSVVPQWVTKLKVDL